MNDCVRVNTEMTNEELLEKYGETKDLKIKQEIALRYVHVVRTIALQMRDVYAGFTQIDDIVQEGIIVLMKQIDKYDKTKNAKFETYLSRRLRGMIIDIARKQDRGSRNIRKGMKDIENAIAELTIQNGKVPDSKMVAEYLNLPYDKYTEILRKNNQLSVVSLDMIIEEAQEKRTLKLPVANLEAQPEESLLKEELLNVLESGIQLLKEKERLVISLYYVEELNMKEIARVLEVSEPRVSQLHSSAIQKLKDYIEQEFSMKQERG